MFFYISDHYVLLVPYIDKKKEVEGKKKEETEAALAALAPHPL